MNENLFYVKIIVLNSTT